MAELLRVRVTILDGDFISEQTLRGVLRDLRRVMKAALTEEAERIIALVGLSGRYDQPLRSLVKRRIRETSLYYIHSITRQSPLIITIEPSAIVAFVFAVAIVHTMKKAFEQTSTGKRLIKLWGIDLRTLTSGLRTLAGYLNVPRRLEVLSRLREYMESDRPATLTSIISARVNSLGHLGPFLPELVSRTELLGVSYIDIGLRSRPRVEEPITYDTATAVDLLDDAIANVS